MLTMYGPQLMSPDDGPLHATLHGSRQSRTVKVTGMLRYPNGTPAVEYVQADGSRYTAPLSWIEFHSSRYPNDPRFAPAGHAR